MRILLGLTIFVHTLCRPAWGHTVTEGMDLLYGDALPLSSTGEPIVTVGLATGLIDVVVTSKTRFVVEFIEAGLRKQTVLAPTQVLTVKKDSSAKATTAQKQYYVDLEGVGSSRKDLGLRAVSKWQKRGIVDAMLLPVGTLFSFHQRTLDTRAQRVVIPMPTMALAQQQANKLSQKFHVAARAIERLTTHPQVQLRLEVPHQQIGIAQNYVRIFTLDARGIEIKQVEHGQGYHWHGYENRTYRGDIYVAADPNAQLAIVNAVGIEDLLQGVVPAELFASAPVQALQAQAVAARNTILAKVGHRHFDAPFHLCAEQHCQVYAGLNKEDPRTDAAIIATRGLGLFHAGQLVDAVYSSSCGGHTENNDAAWGDRANPALRGLPDWEASWRHPQTTVTEHNVQKFLNNPPKPYCQTTNHVRQDKFRWQRVFHFEELNQRVQQKMPEIGTLKDIQIQKRGLGGRVVALELIGNQARRSLRYELPIRQFFGNLNSAFFVMEASYQGNGQLRQLVVHGGGWGHGIGMCQMGAMGRAQAGHSFEQILSHYYNHANVQKLY